MGSKMDGLEENGHGNDVKVDRRLQEGNLK